MSFWPNFFSKLRDQIRNSDSSTEIGCTAESTEDGQHMNPIAAKAGESNTSISPSESHVKLGTPEFTDSNSVFSAEYETAEPDHDANPEQDDRLHRILEHLNIEKEEIRHHREVMKPTLFCGKDGYMYPLLSSFVASCEPSCESGSNTFNNESNASVCPGCGNKNTTTGSCNCEVYYCPEGCTCNECQKEDAAFAEVEKGLKDDDCGYDSKPEKCPPGTSWYPNDYCEIEKNKIVIEAPCPPEKVDIVVEDVTVQAPVVDPCENYVPEVAKPPESCQPPTIDILINCSCPCPNSNEGIKPPESILPPIPGPQSGSPSPCVPPELPPVLEKIISNAANKPGLDNSQCRRVVCYVCEFDQPAATPTQCEPAKAEEQVVEVPRVPEPVKEEEKPPVEPEPVAAEPVPIAADAEPEPCVIAPPPPPEPCVKAEPEPCTNKEPEPCPCDVKQVCDCSPGEPAEDRIPSYPGIPDIPPPCPPEPEPLIEEPQIPPPPPPQPTVEEAECYPILSEIDKDERIKLLSEHNSKFMNKFCACRKCNQDGGICEENNSGPEPYKCTCPECGTVRGDNPECPMCNFASHMDQIKKHNEALAVEQEECTCEDCVFEKSCGSKRFNRGADGKVIYEGAMCQQRAAEYLWQTTSGPNTYRDFSFKDQQFDGFVKDVDANGCAGPCAGVPKKYRGAMSIDEVADWSWCRDKN